jgi:hypothetical protein
MGLANEMEDIFLCHTGADKDWVEELATRLEAEKGPVGQPISVWFDKWDIEPGDNVLSKIEHGLKRSRFVAVVLSPALTRASWPTLEWQSQVYEDPAGKKGRILPILRHQFDPGTGEPLEIPLPLKLLSRFDFTDARKFEPEFLRLLRKLRGERPVRGQSTRTPSGAPAATLSGQEEPTGGEESLVSNLLGNLPQ